mmetsp:Transcript_4422/g.11664  ORF Transcript_4422/g.11664 Transcript_4422/m.11664 type:complete len:86 (-) Transcript_4422:553-810(-)
MPVRLVGESEAGKASADAVQQMGGGYLMVLCCHACLLLRILSVRLLVRLRVAAHRSIGIIAVLIGQCLCASSTLRQMRCETDCNV